MRIGHSANLDLSIDQETINNGNAFFYSFQLNGMVEGHLCERAQVYMSACQCHNSLEAEHNEKKFNLGGEITLRKDIIKNGEDQAGGYKENLLKFLSLGEIVEQQPQCY